MTEENKGKQTEPENDPTGNEEENERKSPAFQAMIRQLNESKTVTAELQEKLSTYDDEKAQRERVDLEAKGEYAKVRDSQASEIAALKVINLELIETHKTETLKNGFRLAASKANVIDPHTAEGLLIAYLATPEADRIDAVEHVAKLKVAENTKALFGEGSPAGISPAKSGTVAGRSGNDWAKVYAERDGDDIGLAEKALKKLQGYFDEHQKFPPKE